MDQYFRDPDDLRRIAEYDYQTPIYPEMKLTSEIEQQIRDYFANEENIRSFAEKLGYEVEEAGASHEALLQVKTAKDFLEKRGYVIIPRHRFNAFSRHYWNTGDADGFFKRYVKPSKDD